MLFLFFYTVIVMTIGTAIGHFFYCPTWDLKPTAGYRKIRDFLRKLDGDDADSNGKAA